MRPRVRLTLSVIVAAAIGILLPASAQASTVGELSKSTTGGWDRCSHGYLCLFDLPNGEGDYIALSSPIELSNMGAWDNRISSVWNRSPYYLYSCDDPGYRGTCTSWGRYMPPIDLAHDLYNSENSISSIKTWQ